MNMKKCLFIFCLVPILGNAQLQHLDSVEIKTIGAAWGGLEKFALLQEKQVDGQAFYYLTYWNFRDKRDVKLIKFMGDQAVLDEVYKLMSDAIAKPTGGRTFFKLGDQVLTIEVKKAWLRTIIYISTDDGSFQLNQRQITKLFGK
jgi:hypothetical protein